MMTDLIRRLRTNPMKNKILREAADELEKLEIMNTRLRTLLQKLEWKSIDKDNMEYSCRIPYNVMDELRRALEPMP